MGKGVRAKRKLLLKMSAACKGGRNVHELSFPPCVRQGGKESFEQKLSFLKTTFLNATVHACRRSRRTASASFWVDHAISEVVQHLNYHCTCQSTCTLALATCVTTADNIKAKMATRTYWYVVRLVLSGWTRLRHTPLETHWSVCFWLLCNASRGTEMNIEADMTRVHVWSACIELAFNMHWTHI